MKENLRILTLLFFLIFSVSGLFANGVKEERFSDIDEKIEAKEYNEALLLLNEYIKSNPEDFDSAQKRVNDVMDVRSEYAELAEEILYVIVNEPTNDEKKLRMIAELEAIEENPSEATRKFIAQTKAAAEFTYYRSKFEEIISKGSLETQNEQYLESLKTNYTGFELYRTHFHQAGYDQEFVDSVENRLAEIDEMIKNYETIASGLEIAYKNLITSLDIGNAEQSLSFYTKFEEKMLEFAKIRNSIVESGWYFRDSFENLQKEDPELTEASFLAFAYRFVLGRASDPNSGMIMALDNLWNYYIEGVKPLVTNQLIAKFDLLNQEIWQTDTIFVLSRTETCNSVLKDTQTFISIGSSVEMLNTVIKTDTENYLSIDNSEYLASMQSAEKLVSNFTLTFDSIKKYNEYENQSNYFEIPKNPEILISSRDYNYKDFVFNINEKIRIERNIIKEILGDIDSQENKYQWEKTYTLVSNILSTADKNCGNILYKNGKELSLWFSSGSNVITENHNQSYNTSYEMLNENLSPNVLSYPKELREIVNEKISQLPIDIENLQVTLEFFNQDSSMQEMEKRKIQEDIETLNSLLNKSHSLVDKADERIALAELAKNEADLRYLQAEEALEEGDYGACRDYIEKSRTKYNESLLYQESEELRASSDAKLLALGDRIIRSENEIVVKEVRELKTRAKNAYYAGNFESAENILTQAKTRWATTNSELDPEIESLLSLVGTALSMKTGRTIPPTAPLYPEMSQLLNIANQYYNEGKNLLAMGKQVEAENVLENAKQKLREVQTVYPLNQDASLLTLKIDQLIDPAAFDEYFTRKVETAKNDYQDKSKQQTVYTELLDLYEINPSYPGLKDFIYNVEIALGIRVKPPDTSALRKSNQLTAQAQKVYDEDSRNEISLNSALQLVNQALEANPDNEEAQILKDRISTSLGGSGTAVLPASAEKLYQQAVQELQRGNTLQAYAIVSSLMENKTYSKSAKIIDLMKRVESLL